ncbi:MULTISPECIES: class I SAM-dependent methyltransferase [unclassified Streptomyces]|uniref:class I SAM-dependent methyltransferase n=1 Tax=unclassified Streptomyces TaxID=2593676 RepID=UPI0028C46F6B|nr:MULTISPECIES: class I SAM-dependent methyltransferase [unclassified Streptomyces]WNO74993.1 class I SAM-dependent methyltransferase [Streptomyces sp. AM8-1-1]
MPVRFDATGKVTLDHIYTQPDPRAYFSVLRPLGYCVPQQAKPYFEKLIKEYREARNVEVPQVLDIGCSYGINAALLKYDATMDELYARYCGDEERDAAEEDTRSREELVARDRGLSRSRRPANGLRVVGLDTSAPALDYARESGFLDDAVHADLERNEPTPRQRAQFAGTDLVISTGCLGYVTERTLLRVVEAQEGGRPWMAHFVLRMFPFDSVERALDGLGYRTILVDEVFKQRRFASPEEQALVLDGMSAAGVDARGLEAEGWLHAQLYLSRPQDTPPVPTTI